MYNPANLSEGQVEVKGIPTFSWRYAGKGRMACQDIVATADDSAAYFSVRGYVDCDGAEETELRSSNDLFHLGTAKCSPATKELCDISGYPNTSFYDDYAKYWASDYGWTNSEGQWKNKHGEVPPPIPNACQWKIELPRCPLTTPRQCTDGLR